MPLLPQSLWPRCTAPASATVPAPALTAAVYLVWLPAKRNWRGDEASLQAVLPVVYAQLEGMQVCVWGGGGGPLRACVHAACVAPSRYTRAHLATHAQLDACRWEPTACVRACRRVTPALRQAASPGCPARCTTHPRPPAPTHAPLRPTPHTLLRPTTCRPCCGRWAACASPPPTTCASCFTTSKSGGEVEACAACVATCRGGPGVPLLTPAAVPSCHRL